MPALGSTPNFVSIERLKERFAGIWYRVLRRWSSGQGLPAWCPTIPGEKRPLACPAGGRLGVHSQGTDTASEFLSAPETDASKHL